MRMLVYAKKSCINMSSSAIAEDKVSIFNKIFINNQFVDSISRKTLAIPNPATEQIICEVAEGDKADIDLAVNAAHDAFRRNSKWRTMDASARGKLLLNVAAILDREKANIAKIEALNVGKPYQAALNDVLHTIDVYRFYAGAADKVNGETRPVDGTFFAYTRCEPIGVVGQIIPWNYPCSLFAWKVAPALACGNCCVVKPSELTPLSALAQAACFAEAGFPAGVLSVVPGYGPTAGAALASHPAVRKICFTGSTRTGQAVTRLAAESNMKRVMMELGGKSAIIVFPDCNLEAAALFCNGSVMDNNGQNCCAGSRNYVHADIYDKFVATATELAKNRIVGDPFDDCTSNGAMISETQLERYLSYVECGKKEGATLRYGGLRLPRKGFFVEPAVFSDVTDDMMIAREEVFGPLQSILKFDSIEDVIDRCNASEYGLAAGVFTSDVEKALYVAHNLKGGITWINCADCMTVQTPFGGFKQSGYGKELGEDALKEYYEKKTVMIKLGKKNS